MTASPASLITTEGWLRNVLSALATGHDPRPSGTTVTLADILDALWAAHELGLAPRVCDEEAPDASVYEVVLPGIGTVQWSTEREFRDLTVGQATITWAVGSDYARGDGVELAVVEWLLRVPTR